MYAMASCVDVPSKVGDLETLILITSCICHDLDHPGYNNIYQVQWVHSSTQQYTVAGGRRGGRILDLLHTCFRENAHCLCWTFFRGIKKDPYVTQQRDAKLTLKSIVPKTMTKKEGVAILSGARKSTFCVLSAWTRAGQGGTVGQGGGGAGQARTEAGPKCPGPVGGRGEVPGGARGVIPGGRKGAVQCRRAAHESL